MSRLFLRSSRSPSVLVMRPRARSPSLESLTPAGRMAERRIVNRMHAKARNHWKEIFASFILIACCVMVVTFLLAWNRKMSAGRKPFKGSRQKGTFGLPEPTKPEYEDESEEEDVYRPTHQAAPRILPKSAKKGKAPAIDVPLRTPAPDIPETTKAQSTKTSEQTALSSTKSTAECSTPFCENLMEWYHRAVEIQADPCKEQNTFICDPSVIFPGFEGASSEKPHLRMLSMVALNVQRKVTARESEEGVRKTQSGVSSTAGSEQLLKSCLEYAGNTNEGVEEIAVFMSRFKLDMRTMTDDPKEDPLERMMELSLDYGIDSPVSFSRKYNVTGKASAPFVFEIKLHPEVREFLGALESIDEDNIEDIYKMFLSRYALLNDSDVTQQLIDADDEIADIMNESTPAGPPARISIGDLANITTVSADRWKQLLSRGGRSEVALNEPVAAEEQALALVTYLSRPAERLAMRRVLAWHMLRYVFGPKEDFLSEMNRTRTADEIPDDDIFRTTPDSKCDGLVAKVSGIRYRALDMLEGVDAVPPETIASVTRIMANFQDAVATVFKAGDVAEIRNRSTHSMDYHKTNVALFAKWRKKHVYPDIFFAAPGSLNEKATAATGMTGTPGHSFIVKWLWHLRAWHSLPPLVKALLPTMASVAKVEDPSAFFRPPYYDATAPAAYNFAALGQIIAEVMAHELVEQRRSDPTVAERWKQLWEHTDAGDADSIYCLRTSLIKNGTWRQSRLKETELADRASHVKAVGSRIAFLAFPNAQHEDITAREGLMKELPGTDLSSKQLFFVIHCALSCARGRDDVGGVRTLSSDQLCMVVYKTRKDAVDASCAELGGREIPNECRYI